MMVFAICCFAFSALCATARLLIGPGLAERIMALDVALVSAMGALAVDAARRDDTTYLVTTVVIAIIGFTATIAASKYLEHTRTAPTSVDTDAGVTKDGGER